MLKEITTNLLNVAYEEGSADSPVIIFLHGFPYDAQSWNQVSNTFVEEGYRTLAPYHRGYGKTNFLSTHTMRSGQYTALLSDVLEFTDAMQIKNFVAVGHD